MRVDPATLAVWDHCGALGDQIEGGDGPDATQPLDGFGRTEQRRRQLEAMGLLIPEVLCEVKAQSRLLKGLRRRGCIAQPKPGCLALLGPTEGEMDGALPLLGHGDIMPEARLTNS
jgi:hypothetical protein